MPALPASPVRSRRWRLDRRSLLLALLLFGLLVLLATLGRHWGWIRSFGGDLLAVVDPRTYKAALAQAEGGNLRWVAQDEALVTYAEKIAKGELNLDPAESAVANDRRVRASGAAHPARAVVAGRPLTVLAARVADDAPADRLGSGAAALIANRLLLGCAEGVLEVTEVKPDGKRAMDARSFAAGVPALRGEEGTWSRA